MGGIFGVISTKQCRNDLFYGVDYHSHLGTRRGGMAVYNGDGIFARDIHSLENSYFRVKFEDDLYKYTGNLGIGVISDTDAQPIVVNSHLGRFAIVTVGKICNIADLEKEMLSQNKNFTELSSGKTNPTELIAQIITCSPSFEEGIKSVQQKIKGSCTFVILTENCLIACRDLYGRTPLIIGKKARRCRSAPSCGFTTAIPLPLTRASTWTRCATTWGTKWPSRTTPTWTPYVPSPTQALVWPSVIPMGKAYHSATDT